MFTNGTPAALKGSTQIVVASLLRNDGKGWQGLAHTLTLTTSVAKRLRRDGYAQANLLVDGRSQVFYLFDLVH